MRLQTRGAPFKSYKVEAAFEDIIQDLQDGIVNAGLVLDYTGDVGAMLSRTQGDTGTPSPYKNAKYMQFCSARLTGAAVAANPNNLAICPYVIFAYELADMAGTVHVGYRVPMADNSDASKMALGAIEKLLEGIVKEVAE